MTTVTIDGIQMRRRLATLREAVRSGFADDNDTTLCAWCGTPASTLYVYEYSDGGQIYAGDAYCSDDCHAEACQ